MIKQSLPSSINIRQLANKQTVLNGVIAFAECPRVNAIILNKEAVIELSLAFSFDEQGMLQIHTRLACELERICQRCLQPMIESVNCEALLSPVANDLQAKQLPEGLEPLLLDDDVMVLADWASDEIFLNGSMIPKHESISCQSQIATEAIPAKADTSSPFAVLKNLVIH